ncbi:hypothetical protein POKO110462_10250 [Pontibacter korlensis]|uniref:hypothetical protein n=1 Tax=Pontibacter korlensis TaxID=400092 RepID=UPI001F3EBA2D|nr:hypothetical protein [Pontibacter korlensis]
MSPLIRNLLAVLAGIIIGSILNMGIIQISGLLIFLPEGADVTTTEGLKAPHAFAGSQAFCFSVSGARWRNFCRSMDRLSSQNEICHQYRPFFLAGGIASCIMLPSPVWYNMVDLAGAYIPVAYMAGKLATTKERLRALAQEPKSSPGIL